MPHANAQAAPSPWISAPRWDLTWLSLSALLVALPPLAHTWWKLGANGVDLLVTVLIGGPHMYATFLRTVLEPRFRERHPLLTWGPTIAVPVGVVLLSIFAFDALLSFFFFWASVHICDQASYIASLYRGRLGTPKPLDRAFDFLVAMAALYTVAMFRFVDGTFTVSGHAIFFPPFLKEAWFPRLFSVGAAALLAAWAVRSYNQWRAGAVGRPYLLFMGLTVGVGFLVPTFGELSVSFQGFNAWHSFQYLGLTFLALNRHESAGAVTLGLVKSMARPGSFFRFYGWNVLLTFGASIVIAVLGFGLKLPFEKAYFTVVLSVLLVHYFHDHVLFTERLEVAAA